MSDASHLPVDAGYDRWSEVYDTEGNPLVTLEQPLVRNWIDARPGLRVADVGCGTGRHAEWLAQAGASVDAFDASDGMLAKARAKVAGLDVRFHRHALPDPLPAANDSIDVVLFALVADHIADLPQAFRELARVLRPGGLIVCTVLHPAMNLRGVTARFYDPDDGSQVRVRAYEHTFSDYVMALLGAGFAIEELVEQAADDALAERVSRAGRYVGWPMLLGMKARAPA